MNKAAEVVFISTPAIGNLVPAIEFATQLTNRDPRISATILLLTFPQWPLVDSFTDSRAAIATTENIRFIHLPPVEPPSPNEYQTGIGLVSLLIEKHKPNVKNELTKFISSESSNGSVPNVILFVDMFCTSMIDVGNEIGVSCYLYFASPATWLGLVLHLPILDNQFVDITTIDFEELADITKFTIPTFAHPVPLRIFPSFISEKNDGFSWAMNHAIRYKETKGIIINTFQELEPYALNSITSNRDLPPVYPVGPVVDHHGPARWQSDNSSQYQSYHEEVMKWLDNQPQSSVVFLCFGSMGSLSGSQVREIASGLEQAGFRFLWSTREPPKGKIDLPSDYTNLEEVLPNGFLERIDGFGLVCGWVPQVAILAHKSIGGFVSHCGWNSILESLWYGVPIATWPLYAEQQMNAMEMVVELKLAVEIRLDYNDGRNLVLAKEVERGVRLLMDGDGEVRQKVRDMSQKSKKAVNENGSSFVSVGHLIDELLAKI